MSIESRRILSEREPEDKERMSGMGNRGINTFGLGEECIKAEVDCLIGEFFFGGKEGRLDIIYGEELFLDTIVAIAGAGADSEFGELGKIDSLAIMGTLEQGSRGGGRLAGRSIKVEWGIDTRNRFITSNGLVNFHELIIYAIQLSE